MPTTILMYHGVNSVGGGPSNPHCIGERCFSEQIRHLAASNLSVLPWARIGYSQAEAGAVGLTFDDANRSDVACSRALEQLGYSALFFVPTEYVDCAGRLARSDIVDLWRRGMGIGSHGHRHAPLVRLGDADLERDLSHSKAILEDIVGNRVVHLSFPGGSYDERVLAVARAVGYERFYTSDWGSNSDLETASGVLRRIAIVDGLAIEAFDDVLRTRYRRGMPARFRVKELAKSALGERNYLRLRRALVKRRSDSHQR
jgi:peptidoglycan/xylan/chitin deacetylase (PgdA/CDA1 family)